MPTKLFGPDNPGNRNGRQKGTRNWWTEARNQLRQALPDAMAALVAAVKAGNVPALKLYFSVVTPPTKPAYPTLALDLNSQSPREILDKAKQLLAEGTLAIDHYNAILDGLLKTARVETSISLAAREVAGSTVLETVQTLAVTAAESGDIDTLETAARSALPYLHPRPQPELPEPTATVSAEPYDQDELNQQWQAEYGDNSTTQSER